MAVKIEQFQEAAKDMLSFLEKRKIMGASDLDSVVGRTFFINREKSRKIEVGIKESDLGTHSYTLCYIWYRKGVVLEARLNYANDYCRIILKNENSMDGYQPIAFDAFSNVVQHKILSSASLERLREELSVLSDKDKYVLDDETKT
jgi:hypothetical protein